MLLNNSDTKITDLHKKLSTVEKVIIIIVLQLLLLHRSLFIG